MYLKKGTLNGKIYLSIAHNYRDAETKKVNAKTIRSLGYFEDLAKQYADPIAHFKQEIAKMNEEARLEKQQYTVNIDPNAKIDGDTRKNIYHYILFPELHKKIAVNPSVRMGFTAIYHFLGVKVREKATPF